MKQILVKFMGFFMNSKKMVLESIPDVGDNTGAFYNYLIDNKYNEKYKIIWRVNEPQKHKKYKNVKFYKIESGKKIKEKISYICGILHQMTAKYIIVCNRRLAKYNSKQIYFNFWHGILLKSLEGMDLISKDCDYFLCPSEFYKDIYIKHLNLQEEKLVYLGGPRNDELFERDIDMHEIFPNIIFDKTIMWMPTFRKQKNSNRIDSTKKFNLGIPIINSIQELDEINNYLKDNKILLLLKLHPAQDLSQIKVDSLSNIKILENEELTKHNIKLYNLVGNTDALITDYSSIYWDYMLLDKSIGFTIDDIEEYKETKGFVFDEPLNYMPGKHMKNIEDLKEYILEIHNEKDDYIEERRKINELVNKYRDNQNCKRIVEFLEL